MVASLVRESRLTGRCLLSEPSVSKTPFHFIRSSDSRSAGGPSGERPEPDTFCSGQPPVLHGIDSEAVDLIATDPPFNKGVKAFEGHYCGWREHQLIGCLGVGMQSDLWMEKGRWL